jgi:hypothetical protein
MPVPSELAVQIAPEPAGPHLHLLQPPISRHHAGSQALSISTLKRLAPPHCYMPMTSTPIRKQKLSVTRASLPSQSGSSAPILLNDTLHPLAASRAKSLPISYLSTAAGSPSLGSKSILDYPLPTSPTLLRLLSLSCRSAEPATAPPLRTDDTPPKCSSTRLPLLQRPHIQAVHSMLRIPKRETPDPISLAGIASTRRPLLCSLRG